ncbi:MAG: acetyl-coenzyme A synthetase N-terminal domain-containing protein, partial [Amphiplicatus sp.]
MTSDKNLFKVPANFARNATINAAQEKNLRALAESDPDAYWSQIAARVDWIKPFTKVSDVSFKLEDFRIKWFEDGV